VGRSFLQDTVSSRLPATQGFNVSALCGGYSSEFIISFAGIGTNFQMGLRELKFSFRGIRRQRFMLQIAKCKDQTRGGL
jgi:hypothetical protein